MPASSGTAKMTNDKLLHWKEYRAAISSTLIMVAAGNAIGWTSPTLPTLMSDNSAIPITPDDSSWINSIMILSSVVSAIPAAYLSDRFGRKSSMLVAAIPYVIGWMMIFFATTKVELYIARIMPGLGYGIIYTISPMYLGEISSDSVRGSLAILITVMNKFGILLQYCIGPYVSMKALAGFNLTIPILFFVTFIWMPESPYYYVKKDDNQAGLKALKRLRVKFDSDEMKKIKTTVAEDMKNKGKFMDLVADPSNRKALSITLVLFATQQFCGSAAVITYAQKIFTEAGGKIMASEASIILGCVQVFVAASAVFLVDRVGRRPLLIISSLGVCVMNVVIGSYFFFKDYLSYDMQAVGLLPVIGIVAYIILYTIGLSTVPMAVTSEMFPTNVKSHATSVLQIFVGLTTFTVTKLFQVIADRLGNYVIFWIFAVCSLLGLIYIYLKLPETKGRSFSAIQYNLKHDRSPDRDHEQDQSL